MAKYTEEKVLYLASRPMGVNVYLDEPAGTDLRRLVTGLLKRGHIKCVASDDASHYYKLTDKGLIAHLTYKLDYAAKHGKETKALVEQLAEVHNDMKSGESDIATEF